MPGEPRYRHRLAILRAIFSESATRSAEKQAVGLINPPCADLELTKQREYMQRYLQCTLPACYESVLREFNGMGTQGSVLYGTDEPTDEDAGSWPRRGIIYATLTWTWLSDPAEPFNSPWLVIGENDFETFVVSRDGRRFCVYDIGGPRSGPPKQELASLDAMLCYAMDVMVRSNRPGIVG